MAERDNVVRFERRRLERRVPGLGPCSFRIPAARAELKLAQHYVAPDPDYREFANELIAASIVSPIINGGDIEGLSERGRAIARVATAEVCGCEAAYRRLSGSGRTGDERLFVAMRERYVGQIERLREAGPAVTDNVVRIGMEARKRFREPGVLDRFDDSRRQLEQMRRVAAPETFNQIDRLRRQTEAVLRPPRLANLDAARVQTRQQLLGPHMVDRLARQHSGIEKLVSRYTSFAEQVGHKLQATVRPTYFGSLERLIRPADELAGLQHLGIAQVAQKQLAAVPKHRFDSISEALACVQQRHLATVTSLGERLRASVGAQLKFAVTAYAAWLERNWAQVYADPEHPPPVMFLLASLPMAIGLPLFRDAKTNDGLLLDRLEAAMQYEPLIDHLQAAVQGTPELDAIAKRHLVQALELLRRGRYIDATPPLYQGLERALREVARRRGIIDGRNRFMVNARRSKARSVDDVFEHLDLDAAYLRYLNAWVFGETGNLARHADFPDELAHRRWALRAVAALVGWFHYCAGDAAPMGELVQRLSLPPGADDASLAAGE